MARIIENTFGRRIIRLSTDDIVNVVREYQNLSADCYNYEQIRFKLNKLDFFLPEDIT